MEPLNNRAEIVSVSHRHIMHRPGLAPEALPPASAPLPPANLPGSARVGRSAVRVELSRGAYGGQFGEAFPDAALQAIVVGPEQPEAAVYRFDHHHLIAVPEAGEASVDY